MEIPLRRNPIIIQDIIVKATVLNQLQTSDFKHSQYMLLSRETCISKKRQMEKIKFIKFNINLIYTLKFYVIFTLSPEF